MSITSIGFEGRLDRVRSLKEFAAHVGLSFKTLKRLIAVGQGPRVTQLSARRIGIVTATDKRGSRGDRVKRDKLPLRRAAVRRRFAVSTRAARQTASSASPPRPLEEGDI